MVTNKKVTQQYAEWKKVLQVEIKKQLGMDQQKFNKSQKKYLAMQDEQEWLQKKLESA